MNPSVGQSPPMPKRTLPTMMNMQRFVRVMMKFWAMVKFWVMARWPLMVRMAWVAPQHRTPTRVLVTSLAPMRRLMGSLFMGRGPHLRGRSGMGVHLKPQCVVHITSHLIPHHELSDVQNCWGGWANILALHPKAPPPNGEKVLGIRFAKDFQTFSGLEAIHPNSIQGMAHEMLTLGHLAREATYVAILWDSITDTEREATMCHLHSGADVA